MLTGQWATYEDRAHVGTRQPSLVAWALLRSLLHQVWGAGDWEIERDLKGKPWLRSPEGERGPSISLSHSGDWAVVATAAQGRLGIDVETHRSRKFEKLAAYAFGPSEVDLVTHGGGDAFYRLWVLREARSKATGAGISEAANRQDQVTGGGDAWIEGAGAQAWHYGYRKLADDLSFGVALEAPADEPMELVWL